MSSNTILKYSALTFSFFLWWVLWFYFKEDIRFFWLIHSQKSKWNLEISINYDPQTQNNIWNNIQDKISINKLWDVYTILKDKAVEQEKLNDYKHIEDSVIGGLVRSLDDPYSLYMSEKENKDFKEDLAWNFEWIWAELQMKDEMVTVVSPLKDSPAMKAWIRPQDIIVKVNNKEITWWALSDVIKVIRWPKWEEVALTILRKWEMWLIDIKIIRDVIHVTSVKYELKNSTWEIKIAYISINQFWDSTIKEYIDSISQAEKDDVKWIVLDLRYNWWWYLDWAVAISSPFLNAWDIVTTMKSKSSQDEKRAVSYNTKIKNLAMVVLINWWSASASEIVAWALRDHKKAILLWSTSFWKWTVQELVPLSWKSSLRVTTAKWYTPKGQNIHKVWINPDVDIGRNYEDLSSWNDQQLNKAIEILKSKSLNEFFDKKESLTWVAVIKYNSSGSIVMEWQNKK